MSSDTVFAEIMEDTDLPVSMKVDIKREFYSYFRNEVRIYPEAEATLIELKRRGIPTATLSDVAYGMDNTFALEDIAGLLKYIDLPYTSNDIGFRKPSEKGLLRIAADLDLNPAELAFVGDEQKDIKCAHNAGAVGILVNRTAETKDYGQDHTINDLSGLLELLE